MNAKIGQGIVARLNREKGRLLLHLAEARAQRAHDAILEQHLPEAEQALDDAIELLRQALGEGNRGAVDDLTIDRIQRACRLTAVSLRKHAEFTAKKMESLLVRDGLLTGPANVDSTESTPKRISRDASPTS